MIVYLFLLIWLGLSVCFFASDYKNNNYRIDRAFGESFVAFGILFSILCFFCSLALTIKPCDIIKTETFSTKIVSIRSQDSIRGSFLIGCGSVGTEQYYVYIKKLPDGSYKQSKLPVKKCRICENSNLEPRVEWDMATKVLPVWLSFGFDMLDYNTKQSGDYRIIVPENTIVNNTIMQSFEIN